MRGDVKLNWASFSTFLSEGKLMVLHHETTGITHAKCELQPCIAAEMHCSLILVVHNKKDEDNLF